MSFLVDVSGGASGDDTLQIAKDLATDLRNEGIEADLDQGADPGQDKGPVADVTTLLVHAAAHGALTLALKALVRVAVPYFKRIPGLIVRIRSRYDTIDVRADDVAPEKQEATVSRIQQSIEAGQHVERRRALIVANNVFKPESGMHDLLYPPTDAREMKQVLTDAEICEFAEKDTVVLENAPRGRIEEAASDMLQAAGPDDLCLIYYSGHGIFDASGNYYLAAADTSANPEATATALDTLKRFLKNSKCRRKLLVIDACYAGTATDDFDKKGNGSPPLLASFESGTGTVVMMATGKSRPAKESPTLNMSIYSHFFVEGLRTGEADDNNDGMISVNDLHNYLVKKVPLLNSDQRPTKTDIDQQGPSIVIGKNRRQLRLRTIRSIEKAINAHLASGFLDDDIARTWKDFLKECDPLTSDAASLQRLKVLEALTEEHCRPSQVVSAWVRLEAGAAPAAVAPERPAPRIAVAEAAPKQAETSSPQPTRQFTLPLLALGGAALVLVAAGFFGGRMATAVWPTEGMTKLQHQNVQLADRNRDLGRNLEDTQRALTSEQAALLGQIKKRDEQIGDLSREQQRHLYRARDLESRLERSERDGKLTADRARALELALSDAAAEKHRTAEQYRTLQLERDEARNGVLLATTKWRATETEMLELRCNLLGTDAQDPRVPLDQRGLGTSWSELTRNRARRDATIADCKAAFDRATDPSNKLRFEYQLARALLADHNPTFLEYLKSASDQGYAAAMTLMGLALRGHIGLDAIVPPKYDEAQKWYEKAIALGDTAAMLQRAFMFRHNAFRTVSMPEAYRLYEQAAKAGSVSAHIYLGEIFLSEKLARQSGLSKDCTKAKGHFEKAMRPDEFASPLKLLVEYLPQMGC